MRFFASAMPSLLVLAIVTTPSSEMSMVVPVSSVSARITEPPLPITSRIFSGLILTVIMRGANSDSCVFAPDTADVILPRMCRRPSFACASATCMISFVMPWILMSICSAVTPCSVPATLKSMSPR